MKGRHVIWEVYDKGVKSLEGDYFENRTDARHYRDDLNHLLITSGMKKVFSVRRVPMNWLKRIWFFVTGRRIIR